MSSEVSTLSRIRIRNTRPRWAQIVKHMIREKKLDGKEKPVTKEGETVLSCAGQVEGKALREKGNIQQKTKQKVSHCGFIEAG